MSVSHILIKSCSNSAGCSSTRMYICFSLVSVLPGRLSYSTQSRLGWELRANTDSALSDNNPRVIINRGKLSFPTSHREVRLDGPLLVTRHQQKKREAILNNPDAWSGWLSHYSRPGMMDALHNCVWLLSGFLEDLRPKH